MMLEVVQLTKTFTNGKAAFHELNFKIENSTIVGGFGNFWMRKVNPVACLKWFGLC